MYSKGIFGQFYPVKSLMHKINPSVKLVCLLLTILLISFSTDLVMHLFLLTLVILMILLTKVPFKNFFNLFYSLRYLYVLVIVLGAIFTLDIEVVLTIILKIIIVFEYIALISYTTSVSELNYGILIILEPFNLFNRKLGNVSYFITSIIKFYPMFVANNTKVLKAGASRGIDYIHSGYFKRLFAFKMSVPTAFRETIREIKRTKLECNLKLFNFKKKRTNINHNKISFYDIILLAFHCLFLIAYILEAGLIS